MVPWKRASKLSNKRSSSPGDVDTLVQTFSNLLKRRSSPGGSGGMRALKNMVSVFSFTSAIGAVGFASCNEVMSNVVCWKNIVFKFNEVDMMVVVVR